MSNNIQVSIDPTTEIQSNDKQAQYSLTQFQRDAYGALISIPSEIRNLIDAVRYTAGWSVGIESLNKRGGYEARSIDVYGYDISRNLAVIQLRRTYQKARDRYPSIDKVYALVGRDDGQLFSHIIESSPRRQRNLGDRTPESLVQWAEKIIFGLKSEAETNAIKRQGDIALVPVRALPKDAIPVGDDAVYFRESHKLVGKLYKSQGTYFVEGGRETRMTHTKREHDALYTCKGQIFRVVLGRRGSDPWWTDATLGD